MSFYQVKRKNSLIQETDELNYSPAPFQLLWVDLQASADAGYLDNKLTQLVPTHDRIQYDAR